MKLIKSLLFFIFKIKTRLYEIKIDKENKTLLIFSLSSQEVYTVGQLEDFSEDFSTIFQSFFENKNIEVCVLNGPIDIKTITQKKELKTK